MSLAYLTTFLRRASSPCAVFTDIVFIFSFLLSGPRRPPRKLPFIYLARRWR